jgi:NAD-dependent SIR2 family protein deacetylase
METEKKFLAKELACVECDKTFIFQVGEQEFFLKKGYDDPKRCPYCRRLRKQSLAKGGGQ